MTTAKKKPNRSGSFRGSLTFCQTCRQTRKGYKPGLCIGCYYRSWKQRRPQRAAEDLTDEELQDLEDAGKIVLCGLCAEPRKIHARRMCHNCYQWWQRRTGVRINRLPKFPDRYDSLTTEQEAERQRRLAEYARQFDESGVLDYRAAQRLP